MTIMESLSEPFIVAAYDASTIGGPIPFVLVLTKSPLFVLFIVTGIPPRAYDYAVVVGGHLQYKILR